MTRAPGSIGFLCLVLLVGCTSSYSVKVHGRTVAGKPDATLKINGQGGEATAPVASGIYLMFDEVGKDPALSRLQFQLPKVGTPVTLLLHLRGVAQPRAVAGVWRDEMVIFDASGEGQLEAVTVRVDAPGGALERRFDRTGDEPTYNGADFGFSFVASLGE